MLRKLRWLFSNRVIASTVTWESINGFWDGDWVQINGQLRRVRSVDMAALTIQVY